MRYLDLVPSRKLFYKNRRLKIFTVTPYPEDSLVLLSTIGHTQKDSYINVDIGNKVYYSVVKNGYDEIIGSKIVLENEIYRVNLVPATGVYEWLLESTFTDDAPWHLTTQAYYPVAGQDYAIRTRFPESEEVEPTEPTEGTEPTEPTEDVKPIIDLLPIENFDFETDTIWVSPYGIYKRVKSSEVTENITSMFLGTSSSTCKIVLEESAIDHKMVIDWGDGVEEEISVGTTDISHNYSTEGEHVVKITTEDGVIPNIKVLEGFDNIMSSVLEMEDPSKGLNINASTLTSTCSTVMQNNVEIRDVSNLYAGNTNIESSTWNGLKTVMGMSFNGTYSECSNLQEVYFPDLNENSFGVEDNQFDKMLVGTDDCTVHFPSELYDLMKDRTDVLDKFGGGSGTKIVFDLYRGGSLDPDINRANARARVHVTFKEEKIIKGEVQDN